MKLGGKLPCYIGLCLGNLTESGNTEKKEMFLIYFEALYHVYGIKEEEEE